MRRFTHILCIVAVVVGAGACENGPPWASGEADTGTQPRRDFGPIAAYDRRLVFVGPGADLPTVALFDFTALSDSAAVRRGVRARITSGDEWIPLADLGWEMGPMRDPWRIIPRGELKMVVSGAGELSAIAFRGDPPVRLEPGPLIAESSPDAGTQLVLRQATLTVRDDVIRGILLDAQLGRAANRAAIRQSTAAAESADTAESAFPVTPTARAGAEAFLVNNGGYYTVFSTSAGDDIAWVSHAGRESLRRGVVLDPIAWSPATEDDGPQLPRAWRLRGPAGGMSGELTAESADLARLGVGDLTALGYILVSGWIEDGAVRRDVYGLVRHVR